MDLSSVLVAAIGVAGTLGGVATTQVIQARQERERRGSAWRREDAIRFMDAKFSLYQSFLEDVQESRTKIEAFASALTHGDSFSEHALSSDWLEKTRRQQAAIDLLGSAKVKEKSLGLIAVLAAWPIVIAGVTRPGDKKSPAERLRELSGAFQESYSEVVEAMRLDLTQGSLAQDGEAFSRGYSF